MPDKIQTFSIKFILKLKIAWNYTDQMPTTCSCQKYQKSNGYQYIFGIPKSWPPIDNSNVNPPPSRLHSLIQSCMTRIPLSSVLALMLNHALRRFLLSGWWAAGEGCSPAICPSPRTMVDTAPLLRTRGAMRWNAVFLKDRLRYIRS